MDATKRWARRRAAIAAEAGGSHDGIGAGDHDLPYRFGCRPTARWTYPFTAEQYCRLLILRGRVIEGEYAADGGPVGIPAC
ncbi:MAG: hypothetical protein IRZ14_14760 [Chloroflexi bacterium]|nr:hypothetical protein [Chloroflexota bacterium]